MERDKRLGITPSQDNEGFEMEYISSHINLLFDDLNEVEHQISERDREIQDGRERQKELKDKHQRYLEAVRTLSKRNEELETLEDQNLQFYNKIKR